MTSQASWLPTRAVIENSVVSTPFSSLDSWRHYRRIEQRVIGQLLQTLLYEDVLSYTVVPNPAATRAGASRFSITLGQPDTVSLQCFITDLEETLGEGAIQPGFVNELVQTLIKDTQSATYALSDIASPQTLEADALERYFTDAHSYHPCYKSRLGFSLQDNQRYGPEFAQPLRVIWLAVPNQLAHASAVDGETCLGRAMEEAGPEVLARLEDYLERQQRRRDEVVLMPVHPWQWENNASSALSQAGDEYHEYV